MGPTAWDRAKRQHQRDVSIVTQLRALAHGLATDDPKSFAALVMGRAAGRLEVLMRGELDRAKREGRAIAALVARAKAKENLK